jgi:hypothetical protein
VAKKIIMKLKDSTIEELGVILKEEFSISLKSKELKDFAYFLVSFYGTLLKFETPPTPSIDDFSTKGENKNGK